MKYEHAKGLKKFKKTIALSKHTCSFILHHSSVAKKDGDCCPNRFACVHVRCGINAHRSNYYKSNWGKKQKLNFSISGGPLWPGALSTCWKCFMVNPALVFEEKIKLAMILFCSKKVIQKYQDLRVGTKEMVFDVCCPLHFFRTLNLSR